MFDRKVILFVMSLYAAWMIIIYKPRKLIRRYTPVFATQYTILLDAGAVSATERLRRTYGLRNWAEVYDLAVQVLHFATSSKDEGWDAPARRNPSTGLVEHAELPPVNLQAWRRLA